MSGKTAKKALALAAAGLALTPCIGVMAEGSHIASADDVEVNTAVETLWCASDCEKLAAEITDELGVLVGDYNKSGDSDIEWSAQDIEFYKPVYLIEDKECGLYVDFDGDNGYAVFTDDDVIYGLTVTGDLDYLKDTDKFVYYSYLSGFMYKSADGELIKFGTTFDESDKVGSATVYPGQKVSGDRVTEPSQINEYVAARYPGYTLHSQSTDMVNEFRYTMQDETSYYQQVYYDSSGAECNSYTEGNCVLNAIYNVMYDWSLRRYVYLRHYETHNIRESIKNDPLYSKYAPSAFIQDGNLKYRWECNDDKYFAKMPVLYTNIRNYAINHGYTVDGYEYSKVTATMKYVANIVYDNDMTVSETTSPVEAMQQVAERDVSCFMLINTSSTYGDHAVAVMGYYIYCKDVKVGFGTYKSVHFFYVIADGWDSVPRIFDPNTSADPDLHFVYINVPRC